MQISGQDERTFLRSTEHQWFTMSKIESTDGNDLVVACSWDGMTHIIDKNFDSAAFNFGENICGFCAGRYCIDTQKNVPCFCYVTFSNRIVLYHDVETLEKPMSLYDALVEKLKGRTEMERVLASVTDRTGNIDPQKVLIALHGAY